MEKFLRKCIDVSLKESMKDFSKDLGGTSKEILEETFEGIYFKKCLEKSLKEPLEKFLK